MKILVNSGEYFLFSMNKCDISQFEVHGGKVYPLCYQLVPGRLVGSKKSSVALSDAVSTSVGVDASSLALTSMDSSLPSVVLITEDPLSSGPKKATVGWPK